VQERVRTLAEVEPMIEFLVVDEVEIDEASWTKAITKGKAVPEMLDATIAGLDPLAGTWDARRHRGRRVRAAAVAAGIVNAEGEPQLSKAQGPVRVAATGRTVGPPLWESLAVLGHERTLARLRALRERVG
jgi:glutamyl-tRNA synthetase